MNSAERFDNGEFPNGINDYFRLSVLLLDIKKELRAAQDNVSNGMAVRQSLLEQIEKEIFGLYEFIQKMQDGTLPPLEKKRKGGPIIITGLQSLKSNFIKPA